MDHFSWGCFVAVKLFITTGFLKLYHLLPESRRVLRRKKQPTFRDAITGFLAKWCLTEQKTFFHFTCLSDKSFADFGCLNTKSTCPKEKKNCQNRLVVADYGVMTKTTGWWTVNAQKKAATLVTNRGIFYWRDSKSEIYFEDFKTSGTFLFLHFTFLIHALNVVKTWRLILQVVEKTKTEGCFQQTEQNI